MSPNSDKACRQGSSEADCARADGTTPKLVAFSAGASAAEAPLCKSCRRVMAKWGVPLRSTRVHRRHNIRQGFARLRCFFLMLARLSATKGHDNKPREAENENGQTGCRLFEVPAP